MDVNTEVSVILGDIRMLTSPMSIGRGIFGTAASVGRIVRDHFRPSSSNQKTPHCRGRELIGIVIFHVPRLSRPRPLDQEAGALYLSGVDCGRFNTPR